MPVQYPNMCAPSELQAPETVAQFVARSGLEVYDSIQARLLPRPVVFMVCGGRAVGIGVGSATAIVPATVGSDGATAFIQSIIKLAAIQKTRQDIPGLNSSMAMIQSICTVIGPSAAVRLKHIVNRALDGIDANLDGPEDTTVAAIGVPLRFNLDVLREETPEPTIGTAAPVFDDAEVQWDTEDDNDFDDDDNDDDDGDVDDDDDLDDEIEP